MSRRRESAALPSPSEMPTEVGNGLIRLGWTGGGMRSMGSDYRTRSTSQESVWMTIATESAPDNLDIR